MGTEQHETRSALPPETLSVNVIRGTSLDDLEAVEIGPIPTSHRAERVAALLEAHTTLDILTELEVIVGGYDTILNGLGVHSDTTWWLDVSIAETPAEPPTRLGPLPTRAVLSAARSLLVTLDEAEDLVQGTERLVTAYARAISCAGAGNDPFTHDPCTHDPCTHDPRS